jgi:hypothetical protein
VRRERRIGKHRRSEKRLPITVRWNGTSLRPPHCGLQNRDRLPHRPAQPFGFSVPLGLELRSFAARPRTSASASMAVRAAPTEAAVTRMRPAPSRRRSKWSGRRSARSWRPGSAAGRACSGRGADRAAGSRRRSWGGRRWRSSWYSRFGSRAEPASGRSGSASATSARESSGSAEQQGEPRDGRTWAACGRHGAASPSTRSRATAARSRRGSGAPAASTWSTSPANWAATSVLALVLFAEGRWSLTAVSAASCDSVVAGSNPAGPTTLDAEDGF